MSQISVDDVIGKYIALRDERTDLRKKYEREDEVLIEQMNKIEAWLKAMQVKLGVTQFKGSNGIAYQQPRTRFTCVDWGVFHNWILEHRRLDMLEKRVGQGALKEFREETNTIPPGLNVFTDSEIVVRKGT
jgi:hypothetical protein